MQQRPQGPHMAQTQVIKQAKNGVDVLLSVLDWPFLLFDFLTVSIFLFKDKVIGLLERGDIQISLGENHHIKLKELSDSIDQEIDPIKEEIQELQEKIEKLSVSAGGEALPLPHGKFG